MFDDDSCEPSPPMRVAGDVIRGWFPRSCARRLDTVVLPDDDEEEDDKKEN
jgi:hypothetical protein